MNYYFKTHTYIKALPSFSNVEKISTKTTEHTFHTKAVPKTFSSKLDSIPEDTLGTIFEEDYYYTGSDSNETVTDSTAYLHRITNEPVENDGDKPIPSDHRSEPLVPMNIDEITVVLHSFMCNCLECYHEDLRNHAEWEIFERAEYWADY